MPISPGELLVVDDEEMNRNMLSRRLERSGFSVGLARDGEEALRKLGERQWDLVLLDQMMPEKSGIDVLRELRTRLSPSELPVIMVTAVADSGKVAEALDAGANDYITKPIDFTIALARIRSQLARKEATAKDSKNLPGFALAARVSQEGLWDWDLLTGRIHYSDRWKEMLELKSTEVSDSPEDWFSRVHPEDLPTLERAIAEHLENKNAAFECEYRMRAENGRFLWMAGRGTAVFNDARPLRMAGSQTDITARKTIDKLTGLPNRIAFLERAETALAGSKTPEGQPFTVLLIDIDRLRLLNDSLGREVGDQILVTTAQRLSEVASRFERPAGTGIPRDPPMVARLDGDEFAILAEALPDSERGGDLARAVLTAMGAVFRLPDHELSASASIGVAISRGEHADIHAVLREAYIAAHAAKARGWAHFALFDEAMRDEAAKRLSLERDLRTALAQGQIAVFYQPRVDLETGTICGFEALVRWKHPERGIVAPVDFIPVAEETGMICEIGLWVLREACRQTQEWRQRWPRAVSLDIAVNVSPVQLRDPEFAIRTQQILKESGLDPSALHLEVTESSLLHNMDEARRILTALKTLGVGLKLDDFATGYSCLAYLSQLPFDSIKIDRSFTVDLARRDSERRELLRTILTMARNLRLGVIAEGIEDEDGAAVLKEMGCRYAQGYYFSRPVDGEAIERMLDHACGTELNVE